MKRSLILFLPLLLTISCAKNEESGTSKDEEQKEKQFTQEVTDVSDKIGIIREALIPIANEWKAAEASNDKLKNTSLSINDDFVLIVENNADGAERFEVDIRKLDKENIRLVDEEEGFGFPGFSIGTIGYQNDIMHFKGEQMIKGENELVFLFKDRDAVGKVLPILVQNINVANGALDKYIN